MTRLRQDSGDQRTGAGGPGGGSGRLPAAAADRKGTGLAVPGPAFRPASPNSGLKFEANMPISSNKAPTKPGPACVHSGRFGHSGALRAPDDTMTPYKSSNPSLEHRRNATKEVSIPNLQQSRLTWPVGAGHPGAQPSRGRPVDREIDGMSRTEFRFQQLSRVHGRSVQL